MSRTMYIGAVATATLLQFVSVTLLQNIEAKSGSGAIYSYVQN